MSNIQPPSPISPSVLNGVPNGYQNLSQIAKASGKLLRHWTNAKIGKTAIAQFKLDHPEIAEPIITKEGKGGGTYAHPSLAARFAAWCDPGFVEHVVAENIRLQEAIRSFDVTSVKALDEASEVRRLACNVVEKTEAEIVLIAKTHFVSGIAMHPEGTTFDKYLPHWLIAQKGRTDLYPESVMNALIAKTAKPKPIKGLTLAANQSYVWV